jgi:hypothetical protein
MKVWYETKKNGLLLIRFRHEGKRYTLTTGLHDSEFNRSIAGKMPVAHVTEAMAKKAVKVMAANISKRTIKIYLFALRACWDWGRIGFDGLVILLG